MAKSAIRVLVVDDSLLFREMVKKLISQDPAIEVVATAMDPFDARDKILAYKPDVITLDVEMPKMNGIEFLKKLIPQYPVPVVVVSSVNMTVFDALGAGAVDFVPKPDSKEPSGSAAFAAALISKIKIASTSRVGKRTVASKTVETLAASGTNGRTVIAVGASTGGTEALYSMISRMPANIPGMVVVQHMPPVFTKMFAERLNNFCPMEVLEAKTGDEIKRGRVLIAPGGFHMRVKKRGGKLMVECIPGDPVNGHCPSVDVLFDTVAEAVGKDAVGVILTGMGCDGAKGLLQMRRRGASTLGQNEESCVVYGMPRVAFHIGAVEKQVSLDNMPEQVLRIAAAKEQ